MKFQIKKDLGDNGAISVNIISSDKNMVEGVKRFTFEAGGKNKAMRPTMTFERFK